MRNLVALNAPEDMFIDEILWGIGPTLRRHPQRSEPRCSELAGFGALSFASTFTVCCFDAILILLQDRLWRGLL